MLRTFFSSREGMSFVRFSGIQVASLSGFKVRIATIMAEETLSLGICVTMTRSFSRFAWCNRLCRLPKQESIASAERRSKAEQEPYDLTTL
ncbi:MAG: hypothetical protein J6Y04_04085 [Bacteroidaceae bacterium]|nr:hypothetical protein [Bacteroidaceae bacterium]